LVILVLTILSTSLYAQKEDEIKKINVSGILVDSADGSRVAGGNIVALTKPESAYIAGATTDRKGKFILKDLPAGHYTLKITNIGYAIKKIDILSDGITSKCIDLSEIRLRPVPLSIHGCPMVFPNPNWENGKYIKRNKVTADSLKKDGVKK